jgi:hypothetical protein
VTINDARTLYGNLSLPFVLNATYAPMSFHVVTSSQDAYVVVVPDYTLGSFGPPTNPATGLYSPSDWNGGEVIDGTVCGFPTFGDGYPITICGVVNTPTYVTYPGPATTYPYVVSGQATYYSPGNGPLGPGLDYGYPALYHIDQYQNIPPATHTTQFNIGAFNITAAEFVNDPAGNWLCAAGAGKISGSAILDTWNQFATRKIGDVYTDTVTITGSFSLTTAHPGSVVYDITLWTWTQNRHTDRTAYEDDWGILNPVKFGTETFPVSTWVYLREGLPDLLVAALPQNYVYRDGQFVRNLPSVFGALGLSVVPYIADNTIEGDQPDLAIIPGVGGLNNYDHTVSTHLPNARLVSIPLDGQIGSSSAESSGAGGNSGGAGGGSGSGGL